MSLLSRSRLPLGTHQSRWFTGLLSILVEQQDGKTAQSMQSRQRCPYSSVQQTLWLKMCLPTLKMFDHVGSGAALHCHDCHRRHLPCATASTHQSHLWQLARMASSLTLPTLDWLIIILIFTAVSLSVSRTNLSCNSMDGASRQIKTLTLTPLPEKATRKPKNLIRREGRACIIPYKINGQLRCQ